MFYHKGITLFVPDKVYYPREDSLLLADVIEKQKIRGDILDIGCGSGLLAILMAKKAKVTAVDLCSLAVKTTIQNAEMNNVKLKSVQSDLFKKIRGRFNLIVFNPPYLPADGNKPDDKSCIGGKTGREVIKKFIRSARKHMKKSGRILLLISSLTGEKEVLDLFEKQKFKSRVIARQKVPWEELLVIEAN